MIIPDKAIRELIVSRRLVIEPFEQGQIQPASVDLRIAGEMLRIKPGAAGEIAFEKEQEYERREADEITIPPRTHVLVRTLEHIELPNDVGGMTKLRSSLSRVGLVMNNAGWVDPGFKGTLTLSVFNSNGCPLRIAKGARFVQLVLMRLEGESAGYAGRYKGQKQVTGKL